MMKRFNLLVYVYRGINTLEEKFTRKNHPDYKSDLSKHVLIVTGVFIGATAGPSKRNPCANRRDSLLLSFYPFENGVDSLFEICETHLDRHVGFDGLDLFFRAFEVFC